MSGMNGGQNYAPRSPDVEIAVLHERLGALTHSVDELRRVIESRDEKLEARVLAVEGRVVAIEHWRIKLAGIAIGMSTVSASGTVGVLRVLGLLG